MRVVDGQIDDVGPATELREHPDETVTNFHHAILLPGFVNAHTPLGYSVFRGFLNNPGLSRWMLAFIGARRRLNTDDYTASAMLGAHGVCWFRDHHGG